MSNDPVARSDHFDEHMRDNPLGAWLVRMARRNRAMIWWIAGATAMILGLTVWVTIVALGANDTAHKADTAVRRATSAKANTRALCRAGNASRRDQRKLWNYVLTFPPPPDETPAAREARLEATVKFKAFVDKVFAPRDCKHPEAVHVPPPHLPNPHGAASNPTDQGQNGQAASAPTRDQPAPAQPGASPKPSRSHHHHSSSPSPSPSTSPSPHPIRSCLRHVRKCLSPVHEVGAGATPGSPRNMITSAAAVCIVVVAVQWWRCRRVSAPLRAPPGHTLRRSAD